LQGTFEKIQLQRFLGQHALQLLDLPTKFRLRRRIDQPLASFVRIKLVAPLVEQTTVNTQLLR
jgi:hypothetical protein